MERINDICLEQVFLDLGSLSSPVPLLEWEVAVSDEPSEGDRSVGDHLIPARASAQFGKLNLQSFPCLRLGHLRLKPQDDGGCDEFRFIRCRVKFGATETAVPFRSP
jgi:hypothetical protein